MVTLFIRTFQHYSIVKPSSSIVSRLVYTVRSVWHFNNQRWYSFLLGVFGYYPFRIVIHNKSSLVRDIKNGEVFISIHSGPYPLAVKALGSLLSDHQEIIVPFFVASTRYFYEVSRRWFLKYRVRIVGLGGAMSAVDDVMNRKGSICLFLDAKLPVTYIQHVSMFGKMVPMSTGPIFLAKKYHKRIVPLYVKLEKNMELHIYRCTPIQYKNKTEVITMNNISRCVEEMIRKTITQWQPVERYLLDAPLMSAGENSRSI